jgi:hypothetical protein
MKGNNEAPAVDTDYSAAEKSAALVAYESW